jgi:hypothetical protein
VKLTDLESAFDELDHTPARPRYTPLPDAQRPRTRRTKYAGWRMEKIYVPKELWLRFANESDRGFWGGHGSRQLWVVYYKEEEKGKFTRRIQAQEYIWSNVGRVS